MHKEEVSKYVSMLLFSPVHSLTTPCMLKQKPSKYYVMGIIYLTEMLLLSFTSAFNVFVV